MLPLNEAIIAELSATATVGTLTPDARLVSSRIRTDFRVTSGLIRPS